MRSRPSKPILTLFGFLILVFTATEFSYAQDAEIAKYPTRPINFIVPVSAGAAGDLACRLITREAEKFLGQPIVVANKPGASFSVGIAGIAAAKPDGYTIGHAGHPGMFVAPLTSKVPYHPVKDLREIMQFGELIIGIFVKGDSQFRKFEDLVAYARKNPKEVTYGSAGVGSFGHLVMEQIARKEGVEFTHVPFKGGPQTETALLGGHILVGTGNPNPSLLETGQTRLLLLIAEEKSVDYPQVPILQELGYKIPVPMFLNIAGPRALPEGIVKKLEDAFMKASKEPDFIKGMKNFQFTVVRRNSKDLEDYVSANYEAFSKLLKEMGLTETGASQ